MDRVLERENDVPNLHKCVWSSIVSGVATAAALGSMYYAKLAFKSLIVASCRERAQ